VDDMFFGFFSNIIVHDSDIKEKKNKMLAQSKKYKELLGRLNRENERLLDTCFLGGDLIKDWIANQDELPEDIISAYEKAYPDLAAETPLKDALSSMDDGELQGLVSGIKGKLFEIKYVDYLNDGELPDGYVAKLAESATQPGWDIEITGPHGEVAQLLQAKATDSISYVQEALEKYPDIDVVTTAELSPTDGLYSHLLLNDASENVINSTISNDDLESYIDHHLDGSGFEMDWSPPILSMAIIAFSSYKKDGLDLYGKAKNFGGRVGSSYICLLLGRGVTALTGFWPLGLTVSLCTRYWGSKGWAKHETFVHLCRTIDNNEKIIRRIEGYVA
jgi:hypothetical protein